MTGSRSALYQGTASAVPQENPHCSGFSRCCSPNAKEAK